MSQRHDTAAPAQPPVHPEPTPEQAKNARKAAIAAFVGGTLEYYDFFLYGSAAALVFNELFFRGIDPALGQILSMATIAIGYVIRPIAAIIIGHIGDKFSRKNMLLFTLVLMGISTTLVGCLPTNAQIGAWAPVLLVLLRVLQGISAAGESAGAGTMALEHAPSNKRAFYASFVNTGSAAGIMTASLAFLLVGLLPRPEFLAWGWRIPFLASVIVAVIGFWIRRQLPESEIFEEVKAEEQGVKKPWPIVEIVVHHFPKLLVAIGLYMVSVVSSVWSAFALSWGTRTMHVPQTAMLAMTIATSFLGLFAQPYFGRLSDKVGRKPVFVGGSIACAASTFFAFWALTTGNIPVMFLAAFCLMTFSYGTVNALFPLLNGELWGTEIRYSGTATASQLAMIVTGFAPVICAAIVQPGPTGWLPVAWFTAAMCVVSALVVAIFIRETRDVATEDLGQDHPHAEAKR